MVAVPSFSLKPSAHAQFATGFTAHEQLFYLRKGTFSDILPENY
jgi:hypothetical protein